MSKRPTHTHYAGVVTCLYACLRVTSKQLSSITHARPIGYGGMLGEAALAALVTTICATMVSEFQSRHHACLLSACRHIHAFSLPGNVQRCLCHVEGCVGDRAEQLRPRRWGAVGVSGHSRCCISIRCGRHGRGIRLHLTRHIRSYGKRGGGRRTQTALAFYVCECAAQVCSAC